MSRCLESGWVFPIVDESTWPASLRILLYLVGLLWFHVGVAVTVTPPLTAIEVITSLKRTKTVIDPENPGHYKKVEIPLWNGAVANLTLIAMGTCAPRIILATLEIIASEFHSGELGVATILGSSAFSLLFVTGVGIVVTPRGQTRYIKDAKPYFALVLFFSLFGFLWVYITLEVITPKIIELWEAFLTLTLYPILIILVYVIDKRQERMRVAAEKKRRATDAEYTEYADTDKGDINITNVTHVMRTLKTCKKPSDLTAEDAADFVTSETNKHISRSAAWYFVGAARDASGGQRLVPYTDPALIDDNIYKVGHDNSEIDEKVAIIQFSSKSYTVLENAGRARLKVMRSGNKNTQVLFRYETIDGTAKAGRDFVSRKGVLVLQPGETVTVLDIDILDNNQWESLEAFYVRLSSIDQSESVYVLGNNNVAQVNIIDEDDPGTLEFDKTAYIVKENIGTVVVGVVRRNGSRGRLSACWKTIDKTAVDGDDYEGGEGELTFEDGESEKSIEIKIYDDGDYEKDEVFLVQLSMLQEDAVTTFDQTASITIVNDDEYKILIDQVLFLSKLKMSHLQLGTSSWGEQFKEAMSVNGGDLKNATTFDYVKHAISFFWKVLAACVPPPSFLNTCGFLTLPVGIVLLGFIIALCVDTANKFGCLIGLKGSVTAVTFTSTFVSLGTSVPDLMATRLAIKHDKYADTSIGVAVGNSAVMVYLGLGLPWLLATAYWSYQGLYFRVPTDILSFSIPVYFIFAVIAIAVLKVRKSLPICGKAELGGPTVPKIVSGSVFVLLWLIFLVLSSLYAYDVIMLAL